MSLFKTKEWWRTRCGANETFDRHSLLAAPLFGKERHDILVVGSHDGYLRMYKPSSQWVDETKSPTNYKSTDLMIETRLDDCIVDLKAGRFVSGSQDLRLAVLTASKLTVFDVALVVESNEYGLPLGDRCELKIAYEHRLSKFPASLTVGPFGGVRGRDFLCVQCLDGTLLFYEQEVFAFVQATRNRLLAEPIVYVPRYDLFVAASSSWCLECHRYQSMAEWSRNKKERISGSESDANNANNLEPDSTYNVGEAVLGIEVVTLSSFEVGIVVLGERHLYCLRDNCASVKYAKRLEYKPLCFRAYVIEPDGKLMVLVIADTSTLMIYEGSTLRWSAQLPFAPVTVARVQLEHLHGVIVILSADGRLEACYLGSEPSLFVAPPLHPRGYDYAAAERELSELRAAVSSKSKQTEDRTSDAGTDAELTVSVNASLDSDRPLTEKESEAERESEAEAEPRPRPICNVAIELSSYATLDDVQVCVDVSKPLLVTDDFYALPSLCERHVAKIRVYLDGDWPAFSLDVSVTVTYRTDAGILRAVRKTSQLPLKTVLRSCPPESTASFVTVVKSDAPPLAFTQLFPEFSADQCQRQGWNALGLRQVHTGQTVTVVSGNAGNRYRVQSNDGLSSVLVVRRLTDRWGGKSEGRATAGAPSVGQNHVRSVHRRIDEHFAARREIDRITKEIGLLTSQLRNVERRMLRAARERNEGSLADTGLPFLFDRTCRAIFALLEDLAKARTVRERAGHELRCSVELLLLVTRWNASDEKYEALRAAIGFEPRPSDRLDWEETADAALTALLESTKSTSSETRCSWNVLTPIASVRELNKLKTRLAHAIGRLAGTRESDIAEMEANDVVEST